MGTERPREDAAVHWPDTGRLWRALMLALTLEVAEALLRGESVPLDRLDPEWTARFGRRSP